MFDRYNLVDIDDAKGVIDRFERLMDANLYCIYTARSDFKENGLSTASQKPCNNEYLNGAEGRNWTADTGIFSPEMVIITTFRELWLMKPFVNNNKGLHVIYDAKLWQIDLAFRHLYRHQWTPI